MAEIKSTLDLIMERTKNLTMTDEEKKKFQRDELAGKVRGWVQRYLDGAKGVDDLSHDFEESGDVRAQVREEAIAQIRPDGENHRILELLNSVGEDTKSLTAKIRKFREDADKEADGRIEAARLMLAEKGVKGEAVIPNPEKDVAWKKWYAASVAAFREELKRA